MVLTMILLVIMSISILCGMFLLIINIVGTTPLPRDRRGSPLLVENTNFGKNVFNEIPPKSKIKEKNYMDTFKKLLRSYQIITILLAVIAAIRDIRLVGGFWWVFTLIPYLCIFIIICLLINFVDECIWLTSDHVYFRTSAESRIKELEKKVESLSKKLSQIDK